ncbi:MAG: SEC-C metal-binding domain-containing protein [Bacteroidota bacterium]
MIDSIEKAFHQIDTFRDGIPFEAIRYLYNHKPDRRIKDRVIFALEMAYDSDEFYDPSLDDYLSAPLWYSIVAENHLDMSFIPPIIGLVTTTKNDWDFLSEQCNYLVGRSCAELGEAAVQKYMEAIQKHVAQNSELAYLFLFDSLRFADKEKYEELVLSFLDNPDLEWLDSMVMHVAEAGFHNTLPRIKDLQKHFSAVPDENFMLSLKLGEIKLAIDLLESPDPEELQSCKTYFETRKDWEEHYKAFEGNFKKQSTPKPVSPPAAKAKKLGRNDPCFCGSGKKYKKCCMRLME